VDVIKVPVPDHPITWPCHSCAFMPCTTSLYRRQPATCYPQGGAYKAVAYFPPQGLEMASLAPTHPTLLP